MQALLKQVMGELTDAYGPHVLTRIGAAELKYWEAHQALRSHLRDQDDVLRRLDLLSEELACESIATNRATAGLTFWVALFAMMAITVAAYIARA